MWACDVDTDRCGTGLAEEEEAVVGRERVEWERCWWFWLWLWLLPLLLRW